MTAAALQQLARAGAGAIIDSLVLGFFIAAIAWAALALLRNHRAAIRFLVVAAALLCLAIMPAVRTLLGGHSGSGAAPLVHLGESFALIVAFVWAVGAAIGLMRVGIGIVSLRRMRNRCRPLTLSPELQQTIRQFCPSRKVELLTGDAVSVPSAIGFFRPAVILPSWLIDELSPADLRQILIHELSHLRRRDDWTNLLQRIVKAVFFFHPAVWWMESRLSLEREMACDDAVLAESPSARDYAECLTRVAEKSLMRRGLALAQAAVSRMRDTTCRVARILQFDRTARGGKLAVSMATIFAITGFGALLQAPTLVSFSPVGARSFHPILAEGGAVPRAFNAKWNPRTTSSAVPHKALAAQTGCNIHEPCAMSHAPSSVAAVPRAFNAKWVPRTTSSAVSHNTLLTQDGCTHEPCAMSHAPHQARMTTDSIRGTTLVFVTEDQNTITVWRITTWEFVPSTQLRADHKTT